MPFTNEQRRAWYSNSPIQKEKSRARQRAKRKEKRDYISSVKDIPCMDCKVKYPHFVMDFDHLRDKKFNIAKSVDDNVSWENLKQEIDKCDVVCSNCHRFRTYKRKFGELV
jgi:hypothetical protein